MDEGILDGILEDGLSLWGTFVLTMVLMLIT